MLRAGRGYMHYTLWIASAMIHAELIHPMLANSKTAGLSVCHHLLPQLLRLSRIPTLSPDAGPPFIEQKRKRRTEQRQERRNGRRPVNAYPMEHICGEQRERGREA